MRSACFILRYCYLLTCLQTLLVCPRLGFFEFCLFTIIRFNCIFFLQPPMSLPHPTALTSVHAASLPHFLPSPALASPVGSSSSQPGMGVNNPPCSTLFVANLGQFVSEHELKEIFGRFVLMRVTVSVP